MIKKIKFKFPMDFNHTNGFSKVSRVIENTKELNGLTYINPKNAEIFITIRPILEKME